MHLRGESILFLDKPHAFWVSAMTSEVRGRRLS